MSRIALLNVVFRLILGPYYNLSTVDIVIAGYKEEMRF
jgi:hypothetical protein